MNKRLARGKIYPHIGVKFTHRIGVKNTLYILIKKLMSRIRQPASYFCFLITELMCSLNLQAIYRPRISSAVALYSRNNRAELRFNGTISRFKGDPTGPE